MPDMSGDQLAASIKQISPETPVIMLTGFGDIMSAIGEKPAGADLVLSKPVTLDNLRRGIAAVMNASKAGPAGT
jgi:FixJ family two-component response regulator